MPRIFKVFALVACLAALTTTSHAAGEAMFSKGHSTWTVVGANCGSAATEITTSIAGFNISAYRIGNLETTIAVYVGPNSNLSATDSNAFVGEKLVAGASGVWELGKNPDLAMAAVRIYCRAASSTARISLALFGYK